MTCVPHSAFNDASPQLVRRAGARILPWDQLADIHCDLVITATENANLPVGDCPVLVLPHGVGFDEQVPDSRSALTGSPASRRRH